MFFLLLLLTIFNQAVADEFIIPSNTANDLSLHLKIGQTIQVSWQTQLDSLTLIVSRWGGSAVGTLLSNEENTGTFEWTIGENDNIDEEALSDNQNYVLLIRDPSGETTDGGGFVNGQLSSRAFVIESNETTTTTTSIASSTSSTTIEPSSTTPPPSNTSLPPAATTTTTSPELSQSAAAGGLSTPAKAGIGAGAGVFAIIALVAGVWLCLRHRRKVKTRSTTEAHQQMSSRYEVQGSTDFYKSHGRPDETGRKPPLDHAVEMPGPWGERPGGIHEIGDGR